MSERLRFAMPKPVPAGVFRRVPPAIFPPLLGMLGLVHAWSGGIRAFALAPGFLGVLQGAVAALSVFAFLAYGGKLLRRPAVLLEELRILPGRAGTAAAVLCVYLFGGMIAEHAPSLGRGVLLLGIGLHLMLLVVLLRVYLGGPPEMRRVTPVWHLNWVGFIVAGRVALLLGWPDLAQWVLWPSFAAALVVWAISGWQFWRAPPPPPLRPMLAIHVAPAALLGTVALGLGMTQIGGAFVLLAGVMALVVMVRLPWLLAAGFSPLWGALTFPAAAVAGALLGLWAQAPSEPLRLIAGLVLIAATLIIVPLFFAVWRRWAQGDLAVKTNAAIA